MVSLVSFLAAGLECNVILKQHCFNIKINLGGRKMALKMRLTRMGDKKSPFYRIIVAESRQSRDGAYVAQVGTFNPVAGEGEVNINKEVALDWIKKGAVPTDTVKALLTKNGVELPVKKAKKKQEKKSAPVVKAVKKTTAKKTTTKKEA